MPSGGIENAGHTDRVRLSLSPEETGTLLGACAWVLGALEILKDRGHSQEEEELHELHDKLAPDVNRLAALVGGARATAGEDEATQTAIEDAFGRVRSAFERWVRLTAADTMAAALEQRIEELEDTIRANNVDSTYATHATEGSEEDT